MLLMKVKIRAGKCEKGFTVIELMIVIAIVAIISVVLVPSVLGIRKKVMEKVCGINSLRAEEMYEVYLHETGKEHSGMVFNTYIQDEGRNICPGNGHVIYEDGKVRCSLHVLDEGDGEEDVPYL